MPQGHTDAAAVVADMYEWGQVGEEIDLTIAVAARKVAAKGTRSEDKWLLGRLYLYEGARGRSASENASRALKWFKLAASAILPVTDDRDVKGHPEAFAELGDCYFGGPTERPSTDSMHANSWWPWRRRGPISSWLRAMYYWFKASEMGHSSATRKLRALLAHVMPTVLHAHGKVVGQARGLVPSLPPTCVNSYTHFTTLARSRSPPLYWPSGSPWWVLKTAHTRMVIWVPSSTFTGTNNLQDAATPCSLSGVLVDPVDTRRAHASRLHR